MSINIQVLADVLSIDPRNLYKLRNEIFLRNAVGACLRLDPNGVAEEYKQSILQVIESYESGQIGRR
jgi:hypothetical protein